MPEKWVNMTNLPFIPSSPLQISTGPPPQIRNNFRPNGQSVIPNNSIPHQNWQNDRAPQLTRCRSDKQLAFPQSPSWSINQEVYKPVFVSRPALRGSRY